MKIISPIVIFAPLNDLYFDRFANQVLYKNRLPNDIDKMYIA